MASVTESVDVAVPIRAAYDQWTQFEDFPKFMDGVSEVRQLNDTLTHWVVEMAGVHREYDAQITEQLPEQRVAWKSIKGPQHAGVVTFHRLDDDHTRVTAQMEMEPQDTTEKVADRTGMLDRQVKGDLKRFKEFIEQREAPTGAWRGQVSRPGS